MTAKERPQELDNCGVYLDLFHSCSSLKGRLRHYYREGNMRSCLPYWNDFWFCCKARMMGEGRLWAEYEGRLSGRHSLNSSQAGGASPFQAGIWTKRER